MKKHELEEHFPTGIIFDENRAVTRAHFRIDLLTMTVKNLVTGMFLHRKAVNRAHILAALKPEHTPMTAGEILRRISNAMGIRDKIKLVEEKRWGVDVVLKQMTEEGLLDRIQTRPSGRVNRYSIMSQENNKD